MYVHKGMPGEHFVLLDFGISCKIDASETLRNPTADGRGIDYYQAFLAGGAQASPTSARCTGALKQQPACPSGVRAQ